MREYEKLLMMNKIYSKLMDEESRKVFEAKCEFMIHRNSFNYWEKIKEWGEWSCPYLTEGEYIIFGAGIMGRYMNSMLNACGKKALFYIDNSIDKIGREIDGIDVLKVEEVLEYPNVKIILSDRKYYKEMQTQLEELGVLEQRLVYESMFCAFSGIQYFDVLEPVKNEVFIDGGAYDGGTVKDFVNWCDGEYRAIYCFEPDRHNIKKCEKYFAENKIYNVELIPKGLSNADKELFFDEKGSGGSHFAEFGSVKIPVTSIDNTLEKYDIEKVTYIKMDIEGSEMSALTGASETIRKNKPRLAICVYHKAFDFVDIPLYLLQLNSDYQFYMRHYASNMCETVLYAE